jgi:circadian clock protein KaiC
VRGAREGGEPGIFVAFEESAANILAHAGSFGWDLPGLQKRKLLLLDARLPSTVVQGGDFDLEGLLAGLTEVSRRMKARRIVFDGINTLLGFLSNPAVERREMFRLAEWIASQGLTGIITCKGDVGSDFQAERDEYLQYLSDGVIALHHRLSGAVPLRRLRIVKCRGIRHVTTEVPFSIGEAGVEVAALPDTASLGNASSERISSGVRRLDTMLLGGFFRGSSVLVSGAPGTAKSTLASAFAEAACRRGERTLYVTFDQGERQLIRDMASVRIDLMPHVKNGRLKIVASRRAVHSAIEDVAWIAQLARQHRARCVVLDPISALGGGGGDIAGEEAATYLLRQAQAGDITVLSTSLLSGVDALGEATATGISTIADTWIHVAYAANLGERNRSLTIVKSRGTGHSNQVRELILTNEGISLADVYAADGEVLMGTLRWQRESEDRLNRKRQQEDLTLRQTRARAAIAETRARLASLEKELEAKEADLRRSVEDGAVSDARSESHTKNLRRLRKADEGEARRVSIVRSPSAARRARSTPSLGQKTRRGR